MPPARYREHVKPIGTCSQIPRMTLAFAACALLIATHIGCSRSVTAPSGVRLDGIESSVGLRPRLPTKAYINEDNASADIYLTDLPEEALSLSAPLDNVSGTIVHVHLFALPKAGKTPIDETASTAAVRTLVVAKGHIGVYGGGGFMLPSGKPGAASIGGSIRAASVRLTGSTPGFDDKMGAAEFSATVSAPRDETRARALAARFEELVRLTAPVAIGPESAPDEEKITTDSFGVPLDPNSRRDVEEQAAEREIEAERARNAPPPPQADPKAEPQSELKPESGSAPAPISSPSSGSSPSQSPTTPK